MAKSGDNFLTLEKALKDRQLLPLAYRYSTLQVHYRKPMEYSLTSLIAADQALRGLYRQVAGLGSVIGQVLVNYQQKFLLAINHDLNSPQALAIVFEILKSNLAEADKLATILNFDQVLGLNLAANSENNQAFDNIPADIQALLEQRIVARQANDFKLADELRQQLLVAGYRIEDGPSGSRLWPV